MITKVRRTNEDVFTTLGFEAGEAATLRVRAELMIALGEVRLSVRQQSRVA